MFLVDLLKVDELKAFVEANIDCTTGRATNAIDIVRWRCLRQRFIDCRGANLQAIVARAIRLIIDEFWIRSNCADRAADAQANAAAILIYQVVGGYIGRSNTAHAGVAVLGDRGARIVVYDIVDNTGVVQYDATRDVAGARLDTASHIA